MPHARGFVRLRCVCGDPVPYTQLLRDLRAERDHWKEECSQLEKRRDELLKLVSDLSRHAISADEAAELHSQIRALIVEVGTLRSQLKETRAGAGRST